MRAITSLRAESVPIGELSKRSGVNIETIRYYERIKILPAPSRTTSGRRVYGATDLRILAFIRRSRELGFSLDEIRAVLRLGGPSNAGCGEVRDIAARHLGDIRAKDRRFAETGTPAGEYRCPMLGHDDAGVPRAGNSRYPAPKIAEVLGFPLFT